ncbi:tRNA-specific adenosine deaminase [Williamsoniiplasma luminosum]|uniref:tRNA-specific adenosine deaminase n=1 Tax=Williamsoniiplasma luminosum TaxID=214888 RepID=A0A2K8NW66_9MOLU|nr:nucleoside deaminase [Williamsoniiplasma luminosum]ATZ16883.1 tRNA-specific adenosine deaminase [Williamsoniiplasma luminosum]
MTNEQFSFLMKAIEKTKKHHDVPISAIIVNQNDEIVSFGFNERERKKEISAHAEIIAINKLAKKIKSLNLNDYKLITTLEPCVMCSEAIQQAKIKTVDYLLKGDKYGVSRHLSVNDIKFKLKKVGTKEQVDYYKNIIKVFFQKLR